MKERHTRSTVIEMPKLTVVPEQPVRPKHYSLAEAAREMGVSYSTARRLLATECARFSCRPDGTVIYPGTKLNRGERVRMSYLITAEDIERINQKMRGGFRPQG